MDLVHWIALIGGVFLALTLPLQLGVLWWLTQELRAYDRRIRQYDGTPGKGR